MKGTFLAVTAFLFMAIAMLTVSAVSPPGNDAIAVSNSPDNVLQTASHASVIERFTAFENTQALANADKTWVAKSVGVLPLNIFRRPFDTVKTHDGYSNVLLKPKIDTITAGSRHSLIAFTGLWGDHFARADV